MGPAKSDDLTTFSAVTVGEVKLRIGDLQSNKAPGPDGILPCLLKISKDVIALSLAIFFNTSLSSGQFPSLFKIANITPILKSTQGPRDCPSNYRPVSLTSILAKLLEGLVFSRIHLFFNDRCPFHVDQFGFRKHRSTGQLLTKVTNDWLVSRDAGLHTAVVCIDLKKSVRYGEASAASSCSRSCRYFGSGPGLVPIIPLCQPTAGGYPHWNISVGGNH